jgi:hypothetical protein
MVAADAPRQLALASNNEPASATLLKNLGRGELKIEFEHARP